MEKRYFDLFGSAKKAQARPPRPEQMYYKGDKVLDSLAAVKDLLESTLRDERHKKDPEGLIEDIDRKDNTIANLSILKQKLERLEGDLLEERQTNEPLDETPEQDTESWKGFHNTDRDPGTDIGVDPRG